MSHPRLRTTASLPGFLLLPSAALLVVMLGVYLIMIQVLPSWMRSLVDVGVYQLGGSALLHGQSIYDVGYGPDAWPFTYPPFAAILFTPLVPLSLNQAGLVMFLGTLVAVGVTVWALLGARGYERNLGRLSATIALTAVAMLLEPLLNGIVFGQVNALIMAVVVWDLARPDGARFKGLGVGLMAGVKVIPGIFIVYLLLTRRWKEAGTAIAGFAGTVAIGFIVAPGEAWRYWTKIFFDTSRVAGVNGPNVPNNQSLLGLVLRTGGNTAVWYVVALLFLGGGLYLAVRAYRLGDDLMGVFTVALTSLLVSPIAWTYHWVWFIVAIVLGIDAIRRLPGREQLLAAGVPAFIFVAALAWPAHYTFERDQTEPRFLAPGGVWMYSGPEEDWTGPKWIVANWYVLTAIAILVLIVLWVRSLARDASPVALAPLPRRATQALATARRYLPARPPADHMARHTRVNPPQ